MFSVRENFLVFFNIKEPKYYIRIQYQAWRVNVLEFLCDLHLNKYLEHRKAKCIIWMLCHIDNQSMK